jgi:FkbM family methyltransferase
LSRSNWMLQLTRPARTALQRVLNRAGYRIERLEQPGRAIDVFDLAVRRTAAERGENFFFVQIGALDGVTADPIYRYVREYHWNGLLVEPQPEAFEHLLQNYSAEPQLQFVNAAIGHDHGNAALYTIPCHGRPTVLQGMASFDARLIRRQLSRRVPIIRRTVPTLPLQSLLARYGVVAIDLLQIDVEGFDYEVIKMVDFEMLHPRIIHYEHIHLSEVDRRACQKLLAGQGYRLHCCGIDTTAIIQA